MSLKDVIKSFLSGDGDLKFNFSALNPKISGNKKDVKKVEILKNAKVQGDVNFYQVQINGPLDDTTKKQLGPLYDAFKDDKLLFVAEKPKQIVSGVIEHEKDPEVQELLNEFKPPVLTTRDFQMLRSGLYLKYLRQNNRAEATRQWQAVTAANNQRDRTIVKLASADYFQTDFSPILKELESQGKKADFSDVFENVVEQQPWAIFVSSSISAEVVCDDVIKKADRNTRYGVNSEVIKLHAIGNNAAKTLHEAVKSLKQSTFNKIEVSETPAKMKVVTAKIYYRDRK